MPEVFTAVDVTVRRGTRKLLCDVNWSVSAHERWAILGPNGAGKTTLMQIAATRLFPTVGLVEVLGEELGATDLSELRQGIGWASSALLADMPPGESVANVILTGAYAITGRWQERYDSSDEYRRDRLLRAWNLEHVAENPFVTLSEGEKKRALIARALMCDPELLLLDEPGAGLDLGGREDLVTRLSALALDDTAPTQVLVTHHVEEIPVGFTHALLLRDGRISAAGPIQQVLTSSHLSAAFGTALSVLCTEGRWSARATQ